MSDVSIGLVKEFFEENQFLVKINRKYIPTKKTRSELEEVDIFVTNFRHQESELHDFVINAHNIKKVSNAIVKVKGWHTETFSPAVLTASPDIFRFVQPDIVKLASNFFGTKDFLKILVIPSLPLTPGVKKRSIEILKNKGVTNVLDFKTILGLITKHIKPNRNYLESDILQLIRLFKTYNMLKGPQMELFTKGRRRKY